MTHAFRPIHSGFETLRHAGRSTRTLGNHRFFTATNEQLTARGFDGCARPSQIFADFAQR
jgi:hypothetical protein